MDSQQQGPSSTSKGSGNPLQKLNKTIFDIYVEMVKCIKAAIQNKNKKQELCFVILFSHGSTMPFSGSEAKVFGNL